MTLKLIGFRRIIEIINFGTDGLRETAQKKLYQLCLEQDVPVPKYSVEKMKTYQGFTYIATCNALGYTCDGISKNFFVSSYFTYISCDLFD